MPDPNPNPNPAPDPKAGDPKAAAGGTAPFDPSKVGDEDFAKIFDDPRTFEHPRFKELAADRQKLKKIEADQAKAKEQELLDQKKHEELAALREKERDEAKGQLTQERINNRVTIEASKKGIKDLDAALKLLDRTNIKVNEDGTIAGITEAVDALVKDKPYLLEGKSGSVGNGTNPADANGGTTKFTMTQIQDPVFYAKNRDAIQIALNKNEIVDDR